MILRILVIVACLVCSAADRTAEAADKRPNFLFILADDQSPETLSAYGNTVC